MKTINLLFLLSFVTTGACSTTKSYPPKFYGYKADEQNLIKNGQIAVGFDEDQVRMVWGDPSRIIFTSGKKYYHWNYNELKPKTSAIEQVILRTGASIERGTEPSVIPPSNTFHDKLSKRVTFENSTGKVYKFELF